MFSPARHAEVCSAPKILTPQIEQRRPHATPIAVRDRLVLILGYDCDDPEEAAAELVPAIESILAAEGISLPTEDLVSFFPISENRGYGNPFDGRQISHVLG